ncbi:4-dihydrotrisporin dehydrogenase [Phascolomyces articulosus]|uniref:4-dihydrotrisporin dehydrogenase n=1 Tax=Phascolomyces articulosus TaxID=60185 RepID=A0AAD5K6Q1_9FUNG|nr:4-dihydrotrisporin dehydrogenase [Phascolomyces articulosus]
MPMIYVVTGTSQGIGLEYVKQLSARDDIVIACARNPEKSEELQALAVNKNVHVATLDIVNLDSVKTAVDKIQTLAPEGIDVLINNAGSPGGFGAHVTTTTPDHYRDAFETNVIGTSNITLALLPLLRKRNTRYIINIASIMASIENTTTGTATSYRVSKTGLNMLTRMMACEFGEESFTVLALHPGWVRTKMGTKHAPVSPEDSISGMLSVIDNLSKEKNGKYISYEGNEIPW